MNGTEKPASRSDWMGVFFGLGIALLAAYQQLKMPPVLPEMLARFDYGVELAGAFMSVFAVIGLFLSFQIGRLMQRQGTAAWLLGGCVLAVLGAIPILAFPEHGWAVLVGRGFEGAAMTILAIAGPTLMTRNAAPRHLPIAAALAATWIPLGGLIATVVARVAEVFLPQHAVWPSVWWAGIGFAGVMALWTLAMARGDGRRLAMPVTQAGEPDLGRSERRALSLVAVCFGFWALQNMAVLSWLPEYIVTDRGLPDSLAKELYGLTVITVATSNVLAVLILKAGFPVARVLAVVLAGQAIVLIVGPMAGSDWTGVLVLVLYGAFAGVTPTCIFGLPGRILGAGRTGTAAFGLMMTGRNTGVLAGPVLVGWVAAGSLGWSAGWWTAAFSTGLAILAALGIHRMIHRTKTAKT